MKKTILLIFSLCITMMLNAITVNSTAGGLSTAITTAGGNLSTLTSLTVTGVIDASDFKTMGVNIRDNMPFLSLVDLSGVTIAAYFGPEGTLGSSSFYSYAANEIPEYTFYGCSGLTSITVPSSVTYIRHDAFNGCTNLTSITIPSSVTSIGDAAFWACTGLTSISITIPSSVTSIGVNTFNSCTDLTSINIPSLVTTIGEGAFWNCSGLITVDVNNPNYSSIDGVLFNKNQTTLIKCPISKIGSYTIASTVANIGNEAFDLCTGLTSIIIASSVTSIGNWAFDRCSGLTSITIPSSVTFIGEYAFSGCAGLTSIYAYPTTPVDLSSSNYVFNNVNKATCTLYVPKNSVDLYRAANQWQDFSNIVEMPVEGAGISKETVDMISIYPNPATNGFYVNGLDAISTLTIVDLNAKTLLTQQVTSNDYISIDSLPKGMYIVKISTDAGTIEKKLIKE